jgi:hypothetical protein
MEFEPEFDALNEDVPNGDPGFVACSNNLARNWVDRASIL